MGVTFGTFSNGTTMVWASIAAEMTIARDFLNGGIVIGDIPDGSIETKHIYAPEIEPWPIEGQFGQFSSGYATGFGNLDSGGSAVGKKFRDSARVERTSIFIKSLKQDEDWKVARAWKSLYVPGRATLEVFATLEYTISYDATSGAPTYPSGATPARAGNFQLAYQRRTLASTNYQKIAASRRNLYPAVNSESSGGLDTGYTSGHEEMSFQLLAPTAGHYDIGIIYNRGSGDSRVTQISVLRANLAIEVERSE